MGSTIYDAIKMLVSNEDNSVLDSTKLTLLCSCPYVLALQLVLSISLFLNVAQ
jgi:hypothetical protein